MTFEEAVVKFIKIYWNDQKKYQKLSSVQNTKYTKDYFDGIGKDLMPNKFNDDDQPEEKIKKKGNSKK